MTRTKQKFLIGAALGSWWLLWALVQFLVMINYGISASESALDSSLTLLALALGGYIMITMVKYFQLSVKNVAYVLGGSIVLAAIGCGAINEILKQTSGNEDYLQALRTMLPLRFVLIWLMLLTGSLKGWLWFHMKEQQHTDHRAEEMKQLIREAELAGLRQQIQPHFIFNSLNSISALAGTNPALARKMIEQLSDFLRGTVKKENSQLVTLSDEFSHLQLYLDIEKVRFGHRLTTTVTAEDAALKMKLPSLLLQPVLENAIKFGLYDTIGEVVITLVAKAEQNNLIVEVRNPFDPESALPKAGTGFGLSSIQRRLSLLFYRNDLLTTRQIENTFITSLKIPQQ